MQQVGTVRWYREPWPWLLMIAPAAALVGGIVTAAIAFRTSDGLVAEDYYKQGLMINRSLEKSENARRQGLGGRFAFSEGNVRIELSPQAGDSPRLHLSLAHPTRAGRDQTVALARVAPGAYAGTLGAVEAARWRVHLEDEAGTWRLGAEWDGRTAGAVFTP